MKVLTLPLAGPVVAGLVVTGLLLTGCTQATESPSVCSEATTTREMDSCLADVLEATEARMAVAYDQLLAKFTEEDSGVEISNVRQQISKAQTAWLAFRRADCDAKFAIYTGGTVRTAVFLGCMTTHTEQRIAEFESYVPY